MKAVLVGCSCRMSYLSEDVFPRAPKDHSLETKNVTVSIYL
jgi:hypothetical protein